MPRRRPRITSTGRRPLSPRAPIISHGSPDTKPTIPTVPRRLPRRVVQGRDSNRKNRTPKGRRDGYPASWETLREGIPPDAGASYLGTYGFGNAWTVWLTRKHPDLVAQPPSRMHEREEGDRRPECPHPPCRHRMVLRGSVWKCFRHGDRVFELKPALELERAPDIDVLSMVGRGEILEGFYKDGRWQAVAIGRKEARKL